MESNKPEWLPGIVELDGDWNTTVERLYRIFEADFIYTERYLINYKVFWDNRKLDGRYDEGFWHIITIKDQITGDRLPDFRRAERLPWCGPCISYCSDNGIKLWDYLEGNSRIHTYLWLEEWDYVIVLEKRNTRNRDIAFLVTAFYVGGNSTRRNLKRKYLSRLN